MTTSQAKFCISYPNMAQGEFLGYCYAVVMAASLKQAMQVVARRHGVSCHSVIGYKVR